MELSETQIARFLDDYGFKHSLCGFRYAISIIKRCSDLTTNKENITDIYKELAKQFETTGSRFERGLRHAIECSLLAKMNNKEFVYATIDALKYGIALPTKE